MTLAEEMLENFEKWVLTPLKEDIEDPRRNHFNSFLLLSIVIDNLATMRYRSEYPDLEPGNIKRRYGKFIENYFPRKYRRLSDKLYRGFRCELVHAFQISGFDLQQGEKARRYHLKKLNSGALCLHSHELLKDVFKAYKKLRAELIGENIKPDVVAAFEDGTYRGWSHVEV
jgi:hypothetical protein